MKGNHQQPPNERSEKNIATRRDFFKHLGLAGAGVVAGAAAIYTGYRYEYSKPSRNYIKILTTDNRVVEVPKDSIREVHPIKTSLTKQGREGIKDHRWIWVIDLSKCRNERKCVAACQQAHHLRPYQYHINVLTMQDSANTPAYYMPKPCQHCDNPPCVSVCPVDATFKRPDGVVLIDNERCIGCRFCIAACPYNARTFHWEEPLKEEEDKDKVYDIELNIPQRKGTISKCLMSSDRLRMGALPYCVSACPNGVHWFGNELEDAVTNGTTHETVRLSTLLKENGAFHLLSELGTKPRVVYLSSKGRNYNFPEI